MGKIWIIALICVLGASVSSAETWDLPLKIQDSNTKIAFELDTTWHLVEGLTSGLRGEIKLDDPKDPLSVHVELHVPVNLFDTHSSSRDEELRSVMAESQFPDVTLITTRLSDICAPIRLANNGKCSGVLTSTLRIRDVTKNIDLPVTIVRNQDSYLVSGSMSLLWAEYNVEDPSILIAKVDPTVKISYSCTVPMRKGS